MKNSLFNKGSLIIFLFLFNNNLFSQGYLETFDTPNRGIIAGPCSSNTDPNSCSNTDFCGVNWSITATNLTSFGPSPSGRAMTVSNNGGVFSGRDLTPSTPTDSEVCWVSPLLNISGISNVSFTVDVDYLGQDSPDYIDVEYSINGGGFTQVPNVVGGGSHTIEDPTNGAGTGSANNVGASNLNGNSLQIRVCGHMNGSTDEMQIDNVSVPHNGVTVSGGGSNPDVPTLSANPSSVLMGQTSTITISGNLNDATQWEVYTGSCGGTNIGSTASSTVNVMPTETTTYFIRGESTCITSGSCGQVTVSLAEPTISVDKLAQAEDDAGVFSFTIDLGANASSNTDVEFKVSGTADDATDYLIGGSNIVYDENTNSGTATVLSGSSTATVTVDPTTDTDIEGDETVILIINCKDGACATIFDDDPMVMINVTQSPQTEDSGQPIAFTFSRTGQTSTSLIINFEVSGTASSIDDYMVIGATTFDTGTGQGTVTISSGNSSQEITIIPKSDNITENNETVGLRILSNE